MEETSPSWSAPFEGALEVLVDGALAVLASLTPFSAAALFPVLVNPSRLVRSVVEVEETLERLVDCGVAVLAPAATLLPVLVNPSRLVRSVVEVEGAREVLVDSVLTTSPRLSLFSAVTVSLALVNPSRLDRSVVEAGGNKETEGRVGR